MMFGARRHSRKPALVSPRDDVPLAVVLTFDPNAIDPATRTQRLGVVIEDGETREPLGARSLRDAADWLRRHGFRFAGRAGVWTRH